MGNFMESFDMLKPSSLPFLEMDPNLELMSQLAELNGSVMDNCSMPLIEYSNESGLSQPAEFLIHSMGNLSGLSPKECPKQLLMSQATSSNKIHNHVDKKRKSMEVPEVNSGTPSETVSTEEMKTKKSNCTGGGKRGRSHVEEGEKPKEVVHVRARRGQATDSHSLAERVRREKINERMRCLQGLVPGCYKTMGMAGMLDEIINYVQSLQNQVDFLSMKLSAASSFYDFNLGMEAIVTPQISNTNLVHESERLLRGGYGACTSFHPTMPF